MKNYILAFLSVFLLFACSEDQVIETTKESTAQTGILTTQMVQDLYHSGESYSYNYSDEIEEGCFQVEPFWYLSKEHVTNDGVGIVIVPVRSPREESSEDLELPIYEQLIYYNSEECGIVADYIAYQSRDPLGSGKINNSDFSGNIFTIKGCSCESYTYGLEKGQFTFGMETPSEYFEECQSTADNRGLGSWLRRIFRPIKCPGYGGGNGGSFWNDLGDFFGSIFGGGGSGGGVNWNWSIFDWSISNYYYDGNGAGGVGGGGNPNMQDFFDFCFFEGIGSQVAEQLENLIAVHDFEICTENFHEIMQECYESGNTSSNNGDPSNGGLIENGNTNTCNSSESYNVHDYLYWLNDLDQNDPNGCLAQAGQDYGSTHNLTYGDGQLMCFIDKVNSFDITNNKLFDLILTKCGTNENCKNSTLECLGKMDGFQKDNGIVLDSAQLDLLFSSSINSQNLCDLGGDDFKLNTTEIIVKDLLNEKPELLLEIDCDQIPVWQNLAQHDPPQSLKDKITDLDENHDGLFGDWNIQTLEGAKGTVVNMDLFSVKIDQMPNNPNTGIPFTPQTLLEHFRLNINDFADGSDFEPYCEISSICSQETQNWLSANPIESIVKIDILGNDGVVACSDFSGDQWKFITLEAPLDSNHPVSGTREFGISMNPDGSHEFYVTGVDRFTSNLQENIAYVVSIGNAFFGADALWESVQNNMTNFIILNSGNATTQSPITNRPDWQKVEDVLKGNKPISDLGCN